jgi:flagellar motor protein MotB
MAKKIKIPDAGPSKAYLVSFGDTMTALLAFFIVLNSLATEQTGAKMHAGTGSFVTAFSKSGAPGERSGNRSKDMIQATQQPPIYALAENLEKNQTEGKVGPDDTDKKDRIRDRDQDNFQRFLQAMDQNFGLETNPPVVDQIVFDSFASFKQKPWGLSDHAIQLAAEMIPRLRKDDYKLEVIVWTPIPGKVTIDKTLYQSISVKMEIENKFWLKPEERKRIRYGVKPWLFSDAKRPNISFILSKSGPAKK